VSDWQIAILVAKQVGVSFLVGIVVGEVFEIEALFKELLHWSLDHLLLAKHGLKDAAVFNEGVVDVSNDRTISGLELIIISVATIIVAELLICPSV
jgi:hypothetical protein